MGPLIAAPPTPTMVESGASYCGQSLNLRDSHPYRTPAYGHHLQAECISNKANMTLAHPAEMLTCAFEVSSKLNLQLSMKLSQHTRG